MNFPTKFSQHPCALDEGKFWTFPVGFEANSNQSAAIACATSSAELEQINIYKASQRPSDKLARVIRSLFAPPRHTAYAKSSYRIAARVAGARCAEQKAVVRLMWKKLLRDGMSPGEIRACHRLYAAHRRSHRPVVGHFGHLRKLLASFARGALVGH